jgi:hypothetical protein
MVFNSFEDLLKPSEARQFARRAADQSRERTDCRIKPQICVKPGIGVITPVMLHEISL